MSTALVTGAGGFVARHLARALRRPGITRVVGAARAGTGAAGFDGWHVADLGDARAAAGLLATERPSVVFHLVGAFRGTEDQLRASNVATAAHLLDAVQALVPATRVVLVGSAAEYGDVPARDQPVRESFAGTPASAYGRAKRELTGLGVRAARERGLHVVVARPFNALGAGIPPTLVAGALVHRLRVAFAGPPPRAITVGTTSSIRDFIAVEDVAEGLVRAAERGTPGEAYNLCSGAGHSVRELLDLLVELVQEPVTVEHDPSLVRAGEVAALVGDPAKAARDLGWRATISFAECVRAAWEGAAAAEAAR